MKKLCLIIPICFIPIFVFPEYGCLVPGYPELLTYQTNPPGGIFSVTPGGIYPSPGCLWRLDVKLSCPCLDVLAMAGQVQKEPTIKNALLMILVRYYLSLPQVQLF